MFHIFSDFFRPSKIKIEAIFFFTIQGVSFKSIVANIFETDNDSKNCTRQKLNGFEKYPI